MNQKRSRNSKVSSRQRENNKVTTQAKNKVELATLPLAAHIHQINSLRQFWWRHSPWAYFNQGLFWGGLVSLTAILSAVGGVALTKIDLVNQEISQRIKGNSSIIDIQLKLKSAPLSVNQPQSYTSGEAIANIDRPERLSSAQSSMLANYNPVGEKPLAVQNTTDDPELGKQIVTYLKQRKFRHVYLVEHIPLKLEQTKIVSNYGQVETANYLKNILGFGNLEAESTLQPSELILQLGKDALVPANDHFYR